MPFGAKMAGFDYAKLGDGLFGARIARATLDPGKCDLRVTYVPRGTREQTRCDIFRAGVFNCRGVTILAHVPHEDEPPGICWIAWDQLNSRSNSVGAVVYGWSDDQWVGPDLAIHRLRTLFDDHADRIPSVVRKRVLRTMRK